ncbi:MAG: hypothetical protein ACTSUV_05290 [Candidatus Ranarchaeia archaeon]
MIQNIWIIHKESGRNIFTKTYGDIQIDKDLVSGFLTAIFSFAESEVRTAGIEFLVMGGLQWLYDYNNGLLFIIAADRDDHIELLRGQLDIIRESFLEEFTIFRNTGDKGLKFLRRWNGSPKAFKNFQNNIDDFVGSWKTASLTAKIANLVDAREVLQHLLDIVSQVPIPFMKKNDLIVEKMQNTINSDPNLKGYVVQNDLKINILNEEISIPLEEFLNSLKKIYKITISGLKELMGPKKLSQELNPIIVRYMKKDWRRIYDLKLATFIVTNLII